MKSSNTTISSTKSPTIEATLYVTAIESEYGSLQESFDNYVAQLPPGFENYVSLGSGNSQINDKPAMWHKMRYTEDGAQSTTTLYLLQPTGNKLFVISCSAITKNLDKYEQDFTAMSFSLILLDN